MRKQYGALVVGAGIGGIRAALDLAVTGHKVALIDRRPNHGGILSQLDHQFPTDHCGMCRMLPLMSRDSSSQFCLRKGLFHDNIDIMLSTELTALEGEPGKYLVSLGRKSTLIDPNKCVSCGKCSEVCPVRVPSEFDAGMSERAAVYLPVPHAIPNHYVLDLDNCQRCWKCHDACPTGAIDFKFEERKDFHILVVDRDPEVADFLRAALEEQNFPLHFADTGQKAVDLLASDTNFGLMLLSMNTNDMDAERILTRSKELRPYMDVVVLAEATQGELAADMVMQGAREHLTKPLAAKTFVPWLDKLYMRIMSDTVDELEVGAVVLAGGFDCYTPAMDPEGGADIWSYAHPGVLTAIEFERLLSHSGPRGGKLLRPGDAKPVKKIAWIQCVGSRDVQKNADFCTGICCMFSIKESVLAKKATNGEVEATIFYMDMRTSGKGYQRYRDKAEQEQGVRFVRSRPHSIMPSDDGGLMVDYLTDAGELVTEIYDMIVLAAGVRPPKNTDKFAQVLGVGLNEWGFVDTQPYAPEKTSKVGVFSAGAFGEPKDISESVIKAGAAAQGASRMIKVYDVLAGIVREPEPEYPDVSREPLRTLVAICTDCPTLEQAVDLDAMAARMARVHSVCKVGTVSGACTAKGWEEIERIATEYKPNRVVIGACMPYAYIPRLKELGRTIGLNPALMDVVDIYTATFDSACGAGDQACKDRAEKEIYANLAKAVAQLQGADPVPPPVMVDVERSALVVGGGLAGMTASMAIADQGYGVCLVESEEELGGMAMRLRTQLDGSDPRKFMEELVGQVNKHPNIKVFNDSRVVLSRGSAGRFRSAIASPDGVFPLEHGVSILATGAHEAKVYESGLCVHKSVMTHLELEEKLADGSLDAGGLSGVAFIQCWRDKDKERPYCSKVCCPEMLKNVLALKERNPNLPVYVFYKDIMTQGFLETYYTKARQAGAIFIRYDKSTAPQVAFEDDKPVITGFDPILGSEIELRPDILSLSSGIEPNDVEDLLEVFGVEVDQDGFYQEADFKWRPVDFLKQGIYACGTGLAPRRMEETVASAKAAAQRALRILSAETIARETVVASVRHSLCSLCQACVAACPYGARAVDLDAGQIKVDEILCQGCGACAAVCPNSATVLKGFHDAPMMSVIDAVLEEPA